MRQIYFQNFEKYQYKLPLFYVQFIEQAPVWFIKYLTNFRSKNKIWIPLRQKEYAWVNFGQDGHWISTSGIF